MVCSRVNCRGNVIFANKEFEKKSNRGNCLGNLCFKKVKYHEDKNLRIDGLRFCNEFDGAKKLKDRTSCFASRH